ncbi:MAG: hypothetical protein JAY90_08340 [Candidatus Thiodiazotropha lotti]|nr:hypothetical protein [Candidatus Thiodiazotropha lotti]
MQNDIQASISSSLLIRRPINASTSLRMPRATTVVKTMVTTTPVNCTQLAAHGGYAIRKAVSGKDAQ